MSRTATALDQSHHLIPTTGKWVWKDGEKPSLEFVSNNPASDRHDRRRDKRQRGLHAQDHGAGARRSDRGAATPSIAGRSYGAGRGHQSRMAGMKSPTNKQGGKQSDHTHVTLDDVKGVALDKTLSEIEDIPKDFESMYSTGQFDDFLMCLLNYFHCFYEKRAHEQKPNPMNIEPSLAEKQYYADLCMKLDTSQKILGQSYCVLVLGIGLEHNHHMACGQSRVSNTYRDRDMYEALYCFCCFVVWITFRRKEYEVIKRELNRILRSDTFNPAIRVKNAPDTDMVEDDGTPKLDGAKEEKKITPAEYRRLHGKRPAIKSIINQRSPALVSILPSPKEEAYWLFKKRTLANGGVENSEDDGLQDQINKLHLDPKKFKMGIIGELMSHYNPITLATKGAENEEEETDDKTGNRRESMLAPTHGKTPPSQEAGISRQGTIISQATTEALSDDD